MSKSMMAMVLEAPRTPLARRDVPVPSPGPHHALLRVRCCGLCRTDLHVRDGELPKPKTPLVLGHQIVGTVAAVGEGVEAIAVGQRIGVPWLGWTCGTCRYCRSGRENLCDEARFTGYQIDGGFAEYALVDARFALPLPGSYADLEVAPLLCAGLIGYRALRMAGDAERLGLFGFGASAHIVAQIARWQGRRVFAFSRPGDAQAQTLAKRLGACWVGGSDETAPEELDAAIVFAPVGDLIPVALRQLAKGGAVVAAGIHMSDIPSFPYEILWGERKIVSVANLTRRDGIEFLELAPKVPIHTEVTVYELEAAEQALGDLRSGRFSGAAVISLT